MRSIGGKLQQVGVNGDAQSLAIALMRTVTCQLSQYHSRPHCGALRAQSRSLAITATEMHNMADCLCLYRPRRKGAGGARSGLCDPRGPGVLSAESGRSEAIIALGAGVHYLPLGKPQSE